MFHHEIVIMALITSKTAKNSGETAGVSLICYFSAEAPKSKNFRRRGVARCCFPARTAKNSGCVGRQDVPHPLTPLLAFQVRTRQFFLQSQVVNLAPPRLPRGSFNLSIEGSF
jgi:hypothetical protein